MITAEDARKIAEAAKDSLLAEITKLYDSKQETQSSLGQLAKLGEECAELSAAIAKYVQIQSGIYECRSSPEKAWAHILEEAGDVYQMMCVAGLEPNHAPYKTRCQLIDRMLFKACRFIEKPELFKRWIVLTRSLGKDTPNARKATVVKRNKKPSTTINMSIHLTDNEPNPWMDGLEGDFYD